MPSAPFATHASLLEAAMVLCYLYSPSLSFCVREGSQSLLVRDDRAFLKLPVLSNFTGAENFNLGSSRASCARTSLLVAGSISFSVCVRD